MNDSNCVATAQISEDHIGLRDTKRGNDGPVLRFSRDEFGSLISKIKNGELDS